MRSHLLPSGVLNANCTPVIGNGVVVDLDVLFTEIDGLAARGVDTSSLLVSANAHIITSYHQTIDKVTERFLGKAKIGTTGRGVGPAYSDKVNRIGLRIQDLFDASILRQKVEASLEQKNYLLVKVYNRAALDPVQVTEHLLSHAERIAPHVADVSRVLNSALDADQVVLFEGAQAHHLDVDHGTYPYVTSSNPIAGGACVGAGVGPTRINRVIGIAKAYTTRVGEGPMPTELFDDDGEKLREIGAEFGTTTGRKRRCGWFDALVVEAASQANAFTDIFLTKLDVLTGWEQIPVCIGVRRERRALRHAAGEPVRLPPRDAGLRVPGRLDRGHHRLPLLRGPAEEHPPVRRAARGALRRADLRHRRRTGPRAVDRDQQPDLTAPPTPRVLEPSRSGGWATARVLEPSRSGGWATARVLEPSRSGSAPA